VIDTSRTSNGPIIYLDVRRGKQKLVIRAAVKTEPGEHRMRSEVYVEMVDRLRQGSTGLVQLTKNNAASGVVIATTYLFYELGEQGDVIRAVDGTPTYTIDAFLNALDKAKDHPKVEIKLERDDQPFTITLVLEPDVDPAVDVLFEKIKRTGEGSYEVPGEVVDAILANPAPAKGARVVPAMKNGMMTGFKLYAIRPHSAFAALGLTNGDTVEKVNGLELTSVDKALEAYTKLRDVKKFVIDLERRGKPLRLIYTIAR
jgi:S1-C subfamily serine protease